MKYIFTGKPDKIFPHLKTGKTYNLEIEEHHFGFLDWLRDRKHPVIISPIHCPYTSWDTFNKNWKKVK